MSKVSTPDARRFNATPDLARDIRARAWAFAFECYRMKKDGPTTAPEDSRKDKNAGIHSDCT